jgi:hypothetical protein
MLREYMSALRSYVKNCEKQRAAWDTSAQKFISAAAQGLIVVYGLRGTWRSRSFVAANHEVIPQAYFANRYRTVLFDCWVAIDIDRAPIDEWPKEDDLEYGDVKITRFDLKQLQRNARAQPRRPDQSAVNAAMLKVMTDAKDEGRTAIQREAYLACRAAFRSEATPSDAQMREAFGLVPQDLKRARGRSAA